MDPIYENDDAYVLILRLIENINVKYKVQYMLYY